ncbi:MAG: IPT/TIG domain-containing protein [Cytophagales bacterium]|nr:IPT/TIG domain-containing protein [Cytophagales bacterium]
MKNILQKTGYLIFILLWCTTSCKEDEPLPQLTIIGITPWGGPPGEEATILSRDPLFSKNAKENKVTFGDVPASVLSSSTTELTVKIPNIPYGNTEVRITVQGYEPDIRSFAVIEKPLGEITGISPVSGPPGTVVTLFGTNLNPDIEAYNFMFCLDPDRKWLISVDEDGKYMNTVVFASRDSLQLNVSSLVMTTGSSFPIAIEVFDSIAFSFLVEVEVFGDTTQRIHYLDSPMFTLTD